MKFITFPKLYLEFSLKQNIVTSFTKNRKPISIYGLQKVNIHDEYTHGIITFTLYLVILFIIKICNDLF